MSQGNNKILRRGYAALNRGDIDSVLEIFDPEIEFRLPEGGINAGTFRGLQELREFLTGYTDAFESLRVELEKFFEIDDRVVVFLRLVARGRISGAEVAVAPAQVWTMRHGKAIRFEVYPNAAREEALMSAGLRK